ncbi:Gfo/Idh/MocA family protein [Natronococcus pandeyae]|nr:Gfo/Idh/MocA family oxidoreductase [Natronococcus pandeyae]
MTRNVGIVGLASFYGPAYAARAVDHPNTTVEGVVSRTDPDDLMRLGRPTTETFATRYDCDVYDDVAALADDADLLVVASRTTRRAADAVTALERECPVLTAKPAAATVDDAWKIAEAASESVPAVTTCPARFDDAIGELARRVHDGGIGKPVSVRASIRHDRVPEDGIDVNAEHAPDQAGAAYAMGYYTADLVEWLADATPVRIAGELDNVNTLHSAHPDLGGATVAHEDGSQSTMTLTYSTDCRERLGNWEAEVVGTDGVLRSAHQGYEGIHWHAGPPDDRTTEAFGRTQSPILDRQFGAFLTTVESGEYGFRVPDPDEVASALELCSAWKRSARSSKTVTLDR